MLGVFASALLPASFAKEPAKVFSIAETDQPPKLQKSVNPVYPDAMSRAGLAGRVTIEFIIGEDGLVEEAWVNRSTIANFERPALDAVLQWQYAPAIKNGQAVKTRVIENIEFNTAPEKAAKAAGVFINGDFDQRPELKKQVVPVYSDAMSRAGLVARVAMEFVIGKDGLVEEAQVVSSNNPWFERPALDAVLQWQFTPAIKNGQAITTRARQNIVFDSRGMDTAKLWSIRKAANHDKLPPELQWDKVPRLLASAYPVYPLEQLQAKGKGRATVTCLLGPNGRIIEAKVAEATSPEFGQAVMAMLSSWKFQPATKAGKPCKALFKMDYEFKPTGGDVPVSDSARKILKELQRENPRIYVVNDLDQPLKAVLQQPPQYPLMRSRAGMDEDGDAVIEFFIDEKGDAQLPRIVSSTTPEFGYAAAQAVATWRFAAPQKGGKAVVVRVQTPIGFTLPPSK